MATIFKLDAVLGVNLANWGKGFGKAGKQADGFVNKVSNSIGSLRGLLGGLGLAFGAGGLALAVGKQFSEIDRIAKQSDKLGIATENLVGLGHAFELTGVGAKTGEVALQRMIRRIDEAAHGAGEARGALKELGLDSKALANLKGDEQFLKIAEAMEQVDDQGSKIRLAMRLFDTEGVALVNTMAAGADGIREMVAEAERLGLTFSREEAARVEAANDAITRLKGTATGFARDIAVSIAPGVTFLTSALTDMGIAARNATSGFAADGNAIEEYFTAATVAVENWQTSVELALAYLERQTLKINLGVDNTSAQRDNDINIAHLEEKIRNAADRHAAERRRRQRDAKENSTFGGGAILQPAALEAGSVEAASAFITNSRGSQVRTLEDIEDNTSAAVRELRRVVEEMRAANRKKPIAKANLGAA